jgi:4-amino-4-deoxy-L-arabinose transferase-like glycosyltransferase
MARFHDWFLPAEKANPLFDGSGNELPGLRDKGVWLLLAFVLLLELVAWYYAEGYPIADSVEFMERARTFVRGERIIDSGQIRPFGFSLLIAPIFLLADWIGVLDPRPVLWTICLLQLACGLLLVFVCVRLGARLGGRRTGLVAGFLVGTNPAFLTYCAMPISGIFAAVCIGFGLESLWERGNARREWIGALWLAAAVLMIYQCALVVATIAACILLRDRRRGLRALRTIGIALLLALALQFLLDRVVYGSFGASLGTYMAQKGGGLLSSICLRLGSVTHLQFLKDWSMAVSRAVFASQGTLIDSESAANTANGVLHSKQPFGWYFEHLPQMLVWPVLFLFACALWKALRRPSWLVSFAWLVFGANLVVMTFNPSKDFRLWLPLLPVVAPLCAWGGRFGWSALGDRVQAARENAFWRRSFTVTLAGSSAVLALTPFLQQNRREYGGYWHAIDYVNQLAAQSYPSRRAQAGRTVEGAPPPKVRVAFDYNWAVFQRESPLVELVKLPSQMNLWSSDALSRARKQELLSILPDFDLLVVHQPVLTENPDLFEWVSRHYQLCAPLYDQRTYESHLGPIYILSRRTGSPTDNVFFEIEDEDDPARFVDARGLEHGLEFAREDGSERLQLLGFEYRTLPPEGLGWITYHWYTPTGLHTPWTVLDRLTSLDERNAWQSNYGLAWRTPPSASWPAHTRLSEGYLVVPAADPYDHELPYRPLGGGYRRGDLIPVRLWMRIVQYEQAALDEGRPVVLDRLLPRLRSSKEPLSPNGDGTFLSPDGTQWSSDEMLHVGNFFIPVQPGARVPDDGQPLPDAH